MNWKFYKAVLRMLKLDCSIILLYTFGILFIDTRMQG